MASRNGSVRGAPVSGGNGHGVLDDPDKVSLGQLPGGLAPRAFLAVAQVLGRRGHDGQERAVGQDRGRGSTRFFLIRQAMSAPVEATRPHSS